MAYLARIDVFPVKGLAPVSLERAKIDGAGALEGDRARALRDDRGRWINGKNFAQIHLLRGLEAAEGEGLARVASERMGRAVEVVERVPGGIPDDDAAWGPTLVSTATLAAVAGWFPGMTEDDVRLRFRANLEIGGVPAFWEDRLYGRRFRIGAVEFDAVNPCRRCIVPSRDALTGAVTAEFQKRFMAMREATLPAWAERRYFDHYYRLTVNTRVERGREGWELAAGHACRLI